MQAPSLGRGWAISLVATATMAVSYLDRQVLGVLAPSVRADLGIDNEAYGWVAAAFSYAYLLATPIAGRLLERLGVRRGLLVSVIVWSLVSASHGLATSIAALFVLRLALGVSEAPLLPGAAASIARALPPAHRPRGLGVLFTGTSLGAMLAPPLAAWLAVALGSWRFGFAGVALVGLLWVPLWLAVTAPRHVRALLDAPPDASAPRPSLLAMLKRPAVLRAGALVLASSPAFAFFFLWSSLYLHDVHGVTQADVGRYLWLPPVLLDLGAVTFGFLAGATRRGTARSARPSRSRPSARRSSPRWRSSCSRATPGRPRCSSAWCWRVAAASSRSSPPT
ncbi:MAG: MFS transporter [Sandaracinaceae bacterium]|nr:MFS transporter [Sandaracinaceae bacterium]